MYARAQSLVSVVLVLLHASLAAAAGAGMDAEAVVRAEVQALNDGDASAVLAFFSPEAKVFRVPENPDRLVGPLSEKMGTHEQRRSFFTERLSRRTPSGVELLDLVSAGDLVVAKLRFTDPPEVSRTEYVLAIYRVREGLIRNLWHVASSHEDPAAPAREAEEVIRRFAESNNRGDVEAFLALFSPHAKNFRNSGDLDALGDKPSATMVDETSRRAAYLKMFAKGAPAQVQTVGTVALGNMIAAREIATLADGKVLDEISVYRVEKGLILQDWFIFYQARP